MQYPVHLYSIFIPMLIPDIYPHCLSAIPIIVVFINTIIITIIIIIHAHFISRILLYPCLISICFQSWVSFYPHCLNYIGYLLFHLGSLCGGVDMHGQHAPHVVLEPRGRQNPETTSRSPGDT